MDNKYANIIDRPHPVSPNRPRMSLSRRAAQFAPFAALAGYDGVIRETARQTEAAVTLDEEEIAMQPGVCVRFFHPDHRKSGGSFETRHDRAVKIDEILQEMTLQSGEIICFRYIVQLIRE